MSILSKLVIEAALTKHRTVAIADHNVDALAVDVALISRQNIAPSIIAYQIRSGHCAIRDKRLRVIAPFPDLVTMRDDIERALAS